MNIMNYDYRPWDSQKLNYTSYSLPLENIYTISRTVFCKVVKIHGLGYFFHPLLTSEYFPFHDGNTWDDYISLTDPWRGWSWWYTHVGKYTVRHMDPIDMSRVTIPHLQVGNIQFHNTKVLQDFHIFFRIATWAIARLNSTLKYDMNHESTD